MTRIQASTGGQVEDRLAGRSGGAGVSMPHTCRSFPRPASPLAAKAPLTMGKIASRSQDRASRAMQPRTGAALTRMPRRRPTAAGTSACPSRCSAATCWRAARNIPARASTCRPAGSPSSRRCKGLVGERIVVYLEHIGRIEGQIVRHTELGLASRSRRRSASATSSPRSSPGSPTGRPSACRRTAATSASCRATRLCWCAAQDGRELTGAAHRRLAFGRRARPSPSARDSARPSPLGRTPGRVVRHFEGGIAVEFILPLSPDRFGEGIIL